jgi:putative nucleotidyltransferase with HDIG domain
MSSSSKMRILFVDDEPVILELLRVSVSSMKSEWDPVFAASAEEGLTRITERPLDVVVTDMHLPGMSGAELLNEVLQRFPATIRILLSGYGDREEVMRCVGATHQFLAKPFRLADLKDSLRRITGLKTRLRSPEIQQLVARKGVLQTLPAVYFEILKALQDPDCPVSRLGEIVATDPALSAKLLQLVNSAFLGFGREIISPDEAVLLLGTDSLRSIVLTWKMLSAFPNATASGVSLEQVWRHSLRVGRLAQRIARREGADLKIVEEAFTAGLLHDVGKLVLAANPAAKYGSVMTRAAQEKQPLVAIERATLQANHAEVGAYLLDLWGLPLSLVEAVALHHEPGRTEEPGFTPLTAVHAANALEHEEAADQPPDPLDAEYLARLNLADHMEAWRQEYQAE